MDDLISRQATIEAMEDVDWYHIKKDGQLIHGANSKENEPLYKAEDVYKVLNDMPSAQPETHEERTETHSCDYISRQAAMEEISKQQTYKMFEGEDTLYLDANDVGSVLASLPSAQPVLTCKGCKYDYYEYAGCRICLRKERDLYEPE